MQPAGIYVHVPFCARVCPYCDFAVLTGAPKRRAAYLRAIRREIAGAQPVADRYDTIYLGGGTPSWLNAGELEELLAAIAERFPLTDDPWVSLESNPEDVTTASLESWRRIGVSTLSLGVQSFDNADLSFLGRLHRADEAAEAILGARAAGFPIVSVDLMFGLPRHEPAGWLRQLERAIELRPDHLSSYQLTIHAGTPFAKQQAHGTLIPLPEGPQADLYRLAVERLTAAGYAQYEVSNFAARPAARSHHNTKYWRHVAYHGLGPSAHSFDGVNRRWWNHRRLPDYIAALEAGRQAVAGEETLGPHELAQEGVMLGLRTAEGIDTAVVAARTGLDLLAANGARLEELITAGLVHLDGTRIVPTPEGMAMADHVTRQIEIPTGANRA